jgi:aryl-alcohol dehydrogenase-like predicted oxidoreductase
MEQRRIGSLEVTLVGLGCNNFGGRLDAAQTARVVDAALANGINFFDTADIYGGTRSEEYLGRALAGRRDQVVVATKFGMRVDDARQGARPDYVRRALEDSLRRLATDRIDLYQLHTPDAQTPIAATLEALDGLVRQGKVREIGCSNFSAAQLREAAAAVKPGAARFVSVQNEYSLLHRDPEREVLAECERLDLAMLPYFPLASGLLTGKYRRGAADPPGARLSGQGGSRFRSERNQQIVEALANFAEARGHALLELAVSWLASRPHVASVIAGATAPEQVHANARAVAWRLTAEELAEIDHITLVEARPAS